MLGAAHQDTPGLGDVLLSRMGVIEDDCPGATHLRRGVEDCAVGGDAQGLGAVVL